MSFAVNNNQMYELYLRITRDLEVSLNYRIY